MSYIILYFSIGLILAILIYLCYCCDYKVTHKDLSWEQYSEIYKVNCIIGLIILFYPLYTLILIFIGLRWCFMYALERFRKWMFKIMDKYFIK